MRRFGTRPVVGPPIGFSTKCCLPDCRFGISSQEAKYCLVRYVSVGFGRLHRCFAASVQQVPEVPSVSPREPFSGEHEAMRTWPYVGSAAMDIRGRRKDLARAARPTVTMSCRRSISTRSTAGSTSGRLRASRAGSKFRLQEDRDTGATRVRRRRDQPRRISRARSRTQSRSFSVARLSCCFLPLASPICSLARPCFQYSSNGTIV